MQRRSSPQSLLQKLDKNLRKLALSLVHSYSTRLENDLLAAFKLYYWLKTNPVANLPFNPWHDPIYRVIYGNFHPLSIAGSLADGGRFNIGGAQQIPPKAMPGLRKAACLYGASSTRCALAEAAEPVGNYRMFRLTPKKEFQLWNLGTVLSNFNYPGLAARVNTTPMSRCWGLQKSPLESQILAHHPRDIGGDGIIYDSQKDPDGKTLAFFLKDDQDALQTFDVVEEKVRTARVGDPVGGQVNRPSQKAPFDKD